MKSHIIVQLFLDLTMNKVSNAGENWGDYYKSKNIDWVNKQKKDSRYFKDLIKSDYGKILIHCIKFLDKNQQIKILEAGCGVGEMAISLSMNYNVKAFDYNKKALEICNKLNNVLNKKIVLYTDDLLDLKIEKEKYNFIYNQAVLEYFTHEEKLLCIKNLKKILKEEGIIVVVCQNTNNARNKNDFTNQPIVYNCDLDYIKKLFTENNFKILYSDGLYTSKVFTNFLLPKFINEKIKYYLWKIIDRLYFPSFIRRKYNLQFVVCAKILK